VKEGKQVAEEYLYFISGPLDNTIKTNPKHVLTAINTKKTIKKLLSWQDEDEEDEDEAEKSLFKVKFKGDNGKCLLITKLDDRIIVVTESYVSIRPISE